MYKQNNKRRSIFEIIVFLHDDIINRFQPVRGNVDLKMKIEITNETIKHRINREENFPFYFS